MKATPGPWRVGSRITNSVVADAPAPGIRGSDDTDYYGGHLIAESVNEPNGLLIAAAPDLLKAAIMALDDCCDLIETPAGNALMAAVAKAQGDGQ